MGRRYCRILQLLSVPKRETCNVIFFFFLLLSLIGKKLVHKSLFIPCRFRLSCECNLQGDESYTVCNLEIFSLFSPWSLVAGSSQQLNAKEFPVSAVGCKWYFFTDESKSSVVCKAILTDIPHACPVVHVRVDSLCCSWNGGGPYLLLSQCYPSIPDCKLS